jgi:uncharacterized protein (DUF1501 family)
MKQDREGLPRRALLAAGAALGGAWLAGRAGAGEGGDRPSAAGDGAAAAAGRPARRRKLLVLELAGGNDGLSTVVPYSDPLYRAARPRCAIDADQVLRIDEKRGLHPNLARLRRAFDAGRLAIVEGVGYPDPNRSHFASRDVWHAADARGRAAGEGWLGRALRALHPGDALVPRAVHVGSTVPFALASRTHPVAHLETPAAYRWVGAGAAAEHAAAVAGDGAPAVVGDLRAVAAGAARSSGALRAAIAAHRPRASWPDGALARELSLAAAIALSDAGVDVLSVTHSGYDTHDAQRPRQDALLAELDAALGALDEELRAADAEVLVLAFSEFGRRVADNASAGTDHGTAGPVLLLGAGVRGGLHGRPCSLSELDQGDLVHTTDLCSVYAAVLDRWLGVPSREVLGGAWPKLEVLA